MIEEYTFYTIERNPRLCKMCKDGTVVPIGEGQKGVEFKVTYEETFIIPFYPK